MKVKCFRSGFVAAVLLGIACRAGAATISVPAGGDFQAALDSAMPGDVIQLEAGATFVGHFVLPVKAGSAYITIRSSDTTHVPPPGVRSSPAYAAYLPKLRATDMGPALATVDGSHHWRIENIQFLANPDPYKGNVIIALGTSTQVSLSQVPHDLILDRVLLVPDASKRGIALNSGNTQVINSYFDNFVFANEESQCIAGWNGPGPFLIENNYLSCGSENVLFGGADPRIPNLVPSDITLRGNRFTKQTGWRGNSAWVVKNLLELKNAQRVQIELNIFEYNWAAAQTGYAILFTPRNQQGTAPWSVVRDVTFQNNIVRHVGCGINILGADTYATSQVTSNIAIRNNLFYDIGPSGWGEGFPLLVLNGPRGVTMDHNTFDQNGNDLMMMDGGPASNFVFTNNFARLNLYGIIGSGVAPGNPSLAAFFPGYTFQRNVLATDSEEAKSLYPATTSFPSMASFTSSFVDRASGNYRLVASSPYKNAGTDGRDIGVNMDALPGGAEAAASGANTASRPAAPSNLRILP